MAGGQVHKSVMLEEVLELLKVERGKKYIDATLGGGGYTEAILNKGGEVLGIDQDPKAVELAKKRLDVCPDGYQTVPVLGLKLINGNFSNLKEIASQNGFLKAAGIVFDLGFASFQIDNPEYGLSFQKDGPLDMRLDKALGVTAADLANSLSQAELSRLFFETGERYSRRIAHSIVNKREIKSFKTTQDLKEIVEEVYAKKPKSLGIHPATKVFLALRIAVNTELENLKRALYGALDLLDNEGRLVIVSFHSGEDAIIKNFFRQQERLGNLKIITKKPLRPLSKEVEENPRSRSAKLRAGEKNYYEVGKDNEYKKV